MRTHAAITDHGENDPIPFVLDGAWQKVADIARAAIRDQQRVGQKPDHETDIHAGRNTP